MRARILLAGVLVTLAALPASGQSVKVSFHDGKIDLQAENATVRAILAEWARVGGTRVVNAERIAGPPITIEFKDAYEQQALEALLRGVAGYIAGSRVSSEGSTSGVDRIVILPTSNAPRATPATAVSRPPGPQPLRRLPLPLQDNPGDLVESDSDAVLNGTTAPRAESPTDLRRRLGQLIEASDDGNDDSVDEPPPAPTNPFGITTGAARPGVITPVPTPRAPRARPGDPATQP